MAATSFEATVLEALRRHQLIADGDNVIVALSGGADSVALFHFMNRFAKNLDIRLFAAHFEHGIRGVDSLKDADFVSKLCDSYGVKLFLEHGHMNTLDIPTHLGTEGYARQLRYSFLNGLAERHHAKVATAHTLSDNAETVLFNAIRGTGPKGLRGISMVDKSIIRPMLEVDKQTVEEYCKANKLSYVDDATNDVLTYSRNHIRHKVLPELERVHGGAEAALSNLAEDMRELDVYIDEIAQDAMNQSAKNVGELFVQEGFQVSVIHRQPTPIIKAVLAKIVGSTINRQQIGGLQQLLRGEVTGVQLAKGRVARVKNGCLVLEPAGEAPEALATDLQLPLQQGKLTLWGDYRLQARVLEKNSVEFEKYMQKDLPFVADYDKIINCSAFRTRQGGDTIAPRGRGVTKTLKKWMNETAVPLVLRGRLPLLASGPKVLWMWGYGFAHGLQPGKGTERLLVLRQLDNAGEAQEDEHC